MTSKVSKVVADILGLFISELYRSLMWSMSVSKVKGAAVLIGKLKLTEL